jgi:hypothetical protein
MFQPFKETPQWGKYPSRKLTNLKFIQVIYGSIQKWISEIIDRFDGVS